MTNTSAFPLVWTLTDGHAGMQSQVKGLAEALGYSYSQKKANLRFPWAALPALWHPWALSHITPESDSLAPPYPDILITSGRRSVPLSLALQKASHNRIYRIHVQDPRVPARYFDKVIVPAHDALRGEKVLVSQGTLHHLTPSKLAQARPKADMLFASYPRPLGVFLIGGSTNRYSFSAKAEQAILEVTDAVLKTGQSIVLMTSSRTPSSLRTRLVQKTKQHPHHLFCYDGTGDNPYLESLAVADFCLVTNDSANMMSEACSTGKPTYIVALPEHQNTPPTRCAHLLQAQGFVTSFSLPFSLTLQGNALQETQRIADLLKPELVAHFNQLSGYTQ